MKKRICIVMSSMIGGGAEKMVMYIVNQLIKDSKKDVTLLLFKKIGVNLAKIDNKVNIIELNSQLNIRGILRLIKVLKRLTPDIIFLSLGPLNAVFSLFLFLFRNSKVIARETNIPSIINKIKMEKNRIYKIIDKLYKFSYKFYDLIIVQSDDMKKDLEINYGIPIQKIKKISNLVDFDLIQKSLAPKDKKCEKFFEDKEKIYGITMGRLTKQKGFDLLIERVKEIKSLNVKIYILGEGEEKEKLNEKILEYGINDKIEILSFDKNPFKYLKKADFFIFPSRVEGFPNSLIEALGTGLPAIVNDCKGGINEIIISGFNGEVIDFNKVGNDLEINLNKILKYNKEKIREDIRKRFNKEIILNKYLNEFQ